MVTIPLPHLHTVSVVMYARVGSRYESEATSGLSHFLEHMLFRGTREWPDPHAFHSAIEAVGGTLYAETGRDYSLYQISVHPESLDEALSLFGEIFRAPAFSGIEVERRVVLEEMLEDFDERGRLVNIDDLARREAWPDHPLGWSIVGPLANVRRFTRADVKRHFARFYGARNMVLCISGGFDPRRALAGARRAMRGLTPGTRAPVHPPDGLERGPRFRFAETDASQSQMQLLFTGPELAERAPEYPALLLLARIIDDGMSARLHARIIDELGLAYSVGASLDTFVDAGLFEIDGACKPASLPALVRECLAIVERLGDERVSDAELDKVKRRYRWDLERAFDDPDVMAGWLGGAELFVRPLGFAEKIERIRRIGPDELREVARRVFTKKRLTVACVGPKDARREAAVRRTVDRFR